ncbi:unnamed protein product, partial [Closterium sp. NIES-54]
VLLLLSTSLVLRKLALRLLLEGGTTTARAKGVRVVGAALAVLVAGVEAVGVALEVEAMEADRVVEAAGAVEEVVVELPRVEAMVVPLVAVEAKGVDSRCRASRKTPPLSSFAHTEYRCFGRLEDAWVDEYGDELEFPNWLKLQGMGVDVYALDFVKINAAIYAMYATELSVEGACYSCVPCDAGVDATAPGTGEFAAALGASASAITGTSESAVALGASASAVPGVRIPTTRALG